MTLGKRPSKKRMEAMSQAVKHASDKAGDPQRVMAIWNDVRWHLKTSAGTYEEIDQIVAGAEVRAKTEIVDKQIREKVLERLSQMRGRLSEFTVGEVIFCANCGQEIERGQFRKDVSQDIEAYICAKCSAIHGLE